MRKHSLTFIVLAVIAAIAFPNEGYAQTDNVFPFQEYGVRAVIKDNATVIVIPFAARVKTGDRARVSLVWLDPNDRELSKIDAVFDINYRYVSPRAYAEIEIPFPLVEPSIWTRLKYSIIPEIIDDDATPQFKPFGNIVSLSQIAGYAFELKAGQIGRIQRSHGSFSVFVEAVGIRSKAPVSGITWDAELSFDDKLLKPSKILTPAEGFAELVFDFPSEIEDDDAGDIKAYAYENLVVTGRIGDFIQSVDLEVEIYSSFTARIQTDKPVYQPGQTIHMRAILFNPTGRSAENENVTLSITRYPYKNEEEVYSTELVASPFGIIQNDWLIPYDAPPGNYEIYLEGKTFEESHIVRVSRYELPTFNVDVKTDRAAYLLEEQPEVTVTGTYLFGKPVPNGKVRIARLGERNQYYVDNDVTVAEGVADEQGVFTVRINPGEDLEYPLESYSHFTDLNYAAYYHDATSGRVEQRRFDIRVTRKPIHVYFFVNNDGGTLPEPLYITTCYADGSPAPASLEVSFRNQVIKARADLNGVAKVFLPGSENNGENNRWFEGEVLEITATDDDGQSGSVRTTVWHGGFPFRLETERTLYHAGESVTLRVISPTEMPYYDQALVVHALSEYMEYDEGRTRRHVRYITSQVVQFEDYKGEVTFNWQPEFQRVVTFTVWERLMDGFSSLLGVKTVIFPADTELRIQTTLDRDEYKPGEDAVLSVQATSLDGRPIETALGIAIVDQAVFERARTDSEFGGRALNRQSWFYEDSTKDFEIAGVRLNDLYTLKQETDVTPELDLLAEALVASFTPALPRDIYSEKSETLSSPPRFAAMVNQMKNLEAKMKDVIPELGDFWDAVDMRNTLENEWYDLRDPWGEPYRMESEYRGLTHTISVWSNGPDKVRGNGDIRVLDIGRNYFLSTEQMIQNALDKQDYPATAAEFFEIMRKNGYPLDALWDPWGTPCEVDITTYGTIRTIRIRSAGPDRKPGSEDDVLMAEFSGGYFLKETDRILEAVKNVAVPPQTVEEFRKVLLNYDIDPSRILDAWGRPYKILRSVQKRPRFDNTLLRERPELEKLNTLIPTHISFSFHSNGANLDDPFDNFDIIQINVVVDEETRQEAQEANRLIETTRDQSDPANCKSVASGFCNQLAGTITDQTGAVFPGAVVTMINIETAEEAGVKTNSAGFFRFSSLPDGIYVLSVTAAGFRPYIVVDVRIINGMDIYVNATLTVADIYTEVQVTATYVPLILEASASTGTVQTAETSPADLAGPVYTPRVREYFPETLLWIPELITDGDGAATTQVKLADAITTWKLAVVASTKDGRIAEAEGDFRTFQPFFLEFNPPQTLTVGDEVTLPVTARNYLDKSRTAKIRVVPNNWSEILDGGAQTVDIQAGDAVNTAFTLRALHPDFKAALRVIAETGISSGETKSGQTGDAIEKSLRVHPDGREIVQTYGDMSTGALSFNISIPKDAVDVTTGATGVRRGELKIYPNTVSILFESVSAMLREPTGCGEQTASLGYANLTALRFARSIGIRDEKIDKIAFGNIGKAVESLKNFTKRDGGVGFYPNYEPDAVLTAYVLGFLLEAAKLTYVNPEEISSKISWLEKHRREWMPSNANADNFSRAALIARSLASARGDGFEVQSDTLMDAHDYYLPAGADLYVEPYVLANFIIASMATTDFGDKLRLEAAVMRLASLAREDGGGVHWHLDDASPFYGWGRSGIHETTGLAVSALSRWRVNHPEVAYISETVSPDFIDSLIRRGMLFLVRERNHNSYWHSTQATLRAMQAVADASAALGEFGNLDGSMEIRIHGKRVRKIAVDSSMRDPIVIDMSEFLQVGDNPVKITSSNESALSNILFSSSYWMPWEKMQARVSPEIRLDVQFDKTEISVGEQTRCFVKIERTGSRSGGMMIASIGLPPGAEVDRASLQALLNRRNGVAYYEVMPDRVVFYLYRWPSTVASTFQFNLSARYPMRAKSAPSILYDYYNPEEFFEIPPFHWIVK